MTYSLFALECINGEFKPRKEYLWVKFHKQSRDIKVPCVSMVRYTAIAIAYLKKTKFIRVYASEERNASKDFS